MVMPSCTQSQTVPRVCRTERSHLAEVRAGLDLAGGLVPLKILREIIRNGVLWAPAEQTLRLSDEEEPRVVRRALRLHTD